MSYCELCGTNVARFNAEIEGTTMYVCEECAKFGKIKNKPKVNIVYIAKKQEIAEPEYLFIEGYGNVVKKARESLNLKQEELAKKLNERESVLHQIESEHFKPSIELAKKLEKALHIHIVDELKAEDTQNQNVRNNAAKSGEFTLGDIANIRNDIRKK